MPPAAAVFQASRCGAAGFSGAAAGSIVGDCFFEHVGFANRGSQSCKTLTMAFIRTDHCACASVADGCTHSRQGDSNVKLP